MVDLVGRQLRKLLQMYKKTNLSIQIIISFSFTVIAVIGMVFVGISLYLRFAASSEANIRDYNSRVIDQVNFNMDDYLKNIMRISDTMYYCSIKNTNLANESLEDSMNLLYEANRDMLISIAVFEDSGNLICSSPVLNLKNKVNPVKQDWFVSAKSRTENFHFSSPHVQNLFEDPYYKYRWVISLSRSVELTSDGKTSHGVLLVDMNFLGIEQLLKDIHLGETGYVYLVDRDGEIIYHPRQQLIYSGLLKENNKAAVEYSDGSHTETFNGQKWMITVKTVGYTGWKIIGVTPAKDITRGYYHIRIFVIFIVFFTLFFMIYLNMFISSKIANPIKKLDDSVKGLEIGNLDTDVFIGGTHEIQHLGKTIRKMVKQMHKLMDDIVVEQESKRKSELDALQSQINPHFLYNTLDSIVWMIECEKYKEAITMVTSLARLFRISLSKGRHIISVGDELNHAKYYLNIQSIRYKNKFTVKIDAEPETLEYTTIKLIIQPLLENSIYHGMEYMDGDGEIVIHTYIKDSDLFIDVSDNGSGIPENICSTLLSGTEHVRSKGSGIGLRNVHERIELYFGKPYGLTIKSEMDEGTTVSIRLPCIPFKNIE